MNCCMKTLSFYLTSHPMRRWRSVDVSVCLADYRNSLVEPHAVNSAPVDGTIAHTFRHNGFFPRKGDRLRLTLI